MSSLVLQRMQDTILAQDASLSAGDIAPHPRLSPAQQLAIYQLGYAQRLTGALKTDYPALYLLAGQGSFTGWAQAYIAASPPRHFNLDRYSHGFAAFLPSLGIDAFPCALAQVEAALCRVFMEDESQPLDVTSLASATAETFGTSLLQPRLASRLLSLEYPLHDWLTAAHQGTLLPPPPPQPSFLYIYRHHNQLRRLPLEAPAYHLLHQLFSGFPVATALESTLAQYPEIEPTLAPQLQSWFALWATEGVFREHPPS